MGGTTIAQTPEGAGPDLGSMLLHHTSNSHEIEFFNYPVELPRWPPLHLGPLVIDVSPTKHVVFMLLAAALCAIVFISVARIMRRRYTTRAPRGLANAIEAFVIYFRDEVALANIGHGGERYVPYVLTLFFFILFMNLLGLVPFGATATGNLSVTAALALLSLLMIEVSGLLSLGPKGYLRTIFFAPKGMHPVGQVVIMLIMAPVELLGKLAKPFALAIRLFANMTAGHFIVLSLLGLIALYGHLTVARWLVAGSSVLMSTAIMLLEIFVAFLQAYIFAMLTSVFIGLIRHAH
ncbi:MAG: F0F1 ATP synthase subunit A [Gemmatimonadetes bacterium]|nr:F0F1 ATP synthase subunit A [Gemmatimonadota bacterium]